MSECVGFVECPCQRCRAKRLAATDNHGQHSRDERAYCGVCRTAEAQRYRVR